MTPKQSYPLHWPAGWAGTKVRMPSNFGKKTIGQATEVLMGELRRLGASEIILSANLRLRGDGLPISNQSNPQDPGIAVYFTLKGKKMVLACDRWSAVEHNIYSVAKHVEAIRGQSRWGVGSVEQTFAGYTALPERGERRAWSEVLGVSATATLDEINEAYRHLAKINHPDQGGSHAAMTDVNEAYQVALKERSK